MIDYRAVILDLKQKRMQLDEAIAALEAVITTAVVASDPFLPGALDQAYAVSKPPIDVVPYVAVLPEDTPIVVPTPIRPKSDAAKNRPREACPKCGRELTAQGRVRHEDWHRNNPDKIAPIRPESLPSLSEPFACRHCDESFRSILGRNTHEERCEKRLTERASVPHVHRWSMDPPKNGIVKGRCYCGMKREDPQDPDRADSLGRKVKTNA